MFCNRHQKIVIMNIARIIIPTGSVVLFETTLKRLPCTTRSPVPFSTNSRSLHICYSVGKMFCVSYSVRITESGQNRRTRIEKPVCITCERGPDCQYVNAVFSASGKYYIEECLGPGVPTYVLRSSPVDDSDNSTDTEGK